jgi:hypothetical protein
MCLRKGKHRKPKRVKVILRNEITTKAQKKYAKQVEKRNRAALLALNRELERGAKKRYRRG